MENGPNAEELKASCAKFLNSCSLSGQFPGMFQQQEFSGVAKHERRVNTENHGLSQFLWRISISPVLYWQLSGRKF
jgi:hypothetical protein